MTCKSCGKEIVWLKTKNGKNMPVNANTIQGKETIYDHKIGHISHFSDCKDADKFRK
ncbi:MAG TPA: hypothetical protein VI727_08035 [Candidatus Brocadiaceae bacterium]|nr:hypothetical protein [Candidatus Brocadiaceae bacterium]